MDSATGDGDRSVTVHQLLQRLAPAYLEAFGSSMPVRHREVLLKILSCRTPARGGQLFVCPDCHHVHYRYHSCNDRHCPQCGQTDADDWLARQRSRLLLPIPYFLVTFTVPDSLRSIIRSHQQLTLDLLFATSSRALQDLAANPRRLGAQLGMLGVLHTWSRTLIYHPHIHYLIPAGGLSLDARTWIAARGKFLLHHKALGARFRTLFRERLLKANPDLYAMVPDRVWNQPWNVGAQHAGSGENALRYLARYVFKTATGNRTVKIAPNGNLLWPYRHSQTRKRTAVELEPLQFMSRFLQHILPRSFARVRTFGWLHPAAKIRGNRVRALLRKEPLLTAREKASWKPPSPPDSQPVEKSPPPTSPACPHCQLPMHFIASWRPGQEIPNRPP